MSYLYSKLPETGVPLLIGTGGPHDMAGPLKLVARHKKRKAVGDEERAHNFKRCAGL